MSWIQDTLKKWQKSPEADKNPDPEIPPQGEKTLEASCGDYTIYSQNGHLLIDDGFGELPLVAQGNGRFQNKYYAYETSAAAFVTDLKTKMKTTCQ